MTCGFARLGRGRQRDIGAVEIPQRSSLVPDRGMLSFLPEAREILGSETAPVHHAARRRGRVAARGARARARTAHRRAPACIFRQCGISGVGPSVRTGAGAIGLDRRPQRADRHPLGYGCCRRSPPCGGLAALAPDVILAHGASSVTSLLQVTRTVPIVFPTAVDPVGAGIVDSLARPGGNATGFSGLEYGLSGKWLELLKEIAPEMTRAAVLRDPANPGGPALFGIIQAVAPSLRVEVIPINMRDAGEIERSVAAFAHSSIGGLIITPNPFAFAHRDLILTLAARHKLPAIYFDRAFVTAGGRSPMGLISSTSTG